MDDCLGLTGLPFKMTPEVMLEAAHWAATQGSYQEAEDAIMRSRKLKINDDTVRQVANYIGGAVFREDCLQAEIAWGRLNSGKLRFPQHARRIVP